jgi:hypothetical protein
MVTNFSGTNPSQLVAGLEQHIQEVAFRLSVFPVKRKSLNGELKTLRLISRNATQTKRFSELTENR